MKKFRINSILSRLFISFLLVVVPIVVSGIVMISWERQTIQSQIKDSALDNISFLQNNLENEVENVKLLQNNLAGDNTLNQLVVQYADLPKYDYYTMMLAVQERLRVIENCNNFIEDVIIYIPEMGYSISATNGCTILGKSEYESLYQTQQDAKFPLLFNSFELFSVSSYPLSVKENTVPLFLTKIILSQSKVEEFLNKFSNYNDSNTALYDYTSGRWIFSYLSSFENVDEAKLEIITGAAGENRYTVAEIAGKKYYVVSSYSRYLNSSFVQYIPLGDFFSVPDRYSNFLWAYIIFAIMIMMAYSWLTYRFVKYPINIILEAFKRLENGNLDTRVQLKAANEFNVLYEGFNKMVVRLNELIDRVYRRELYAKKSELKQLQSQINPHFLYNTYYMLNRLIRYGELENAELLSDYLGTYLEYITRNALDEVPLQNELDHALSYAQIQQMRFSRRLSLEFGEIPEAYREFKVPRLILQPIIENSFEHGLKSVEENGQLRVGFEEAGHGLLITVQDSGDVLRDEDIAALQHKLDSADNAAETTGIINVHRRIMLKYGEGSGITVSRSTLGGLRVEIRINPEDGNTEK